MQVLVAGAGIGGLAASLAMLRRGIGVRVFEQSGTLGDVGAGLQIAPSGTRILIELGLEREMLSVACLAAWKEVRLWDSGRAWRLFDLGQDSIDRFGAPYWFVHRGDLHRVLREAVLREGGAIETNAASTGYGQDARGVLLHLGERRVRGDVLIGADGVHSAIRRQMAGDGQASFTGIVAWRGLIETGRLPPELRRPVGTNWIGPGGHVITYPVRRGELLNIAAFCERSDWTLESWSTRGTPAEFAADFEGWNPLVHAMIGAVEEPYKWALVGREPLRGWVDERVALLGDACHPTLPFLAHGAVMALEDGVALARCLEAWADDVPRALATYERMRLGRTTAIVEGSAANAKRFHNPILADGERAIRYVEEEWTPDKVRTRYDWLFSHDAMTSPLGEPTGPMKVTACC